MLNKVSEHTAITCKMTEQSDYSWWNSVIITTHSLQSLFHLSISTRAFISAWTSALIKLHISLHIKDCSQWRWRTLSLTCRRFWTSVYNNWKRAENLWKHKQINIRRMSYMRWETWYDCQTAILSLQDHVKIWKISSWDCFVSKNRWELFISWSYLLLCEFMMSSASSCFTHA